jgi:phospholipase C
MRTRIRWILPALAALVAAAGAVSTRAGETASADGRTKTPIEHLVVIFQENVSFDHYFGTYPKAADTDGQPFAAAPGTPGVDGLTPALLTANPNSAPPKRLDSSPVGTGSSPGGEITCDQDHNYSDEQQAFDGGAMDQFVQSVGTDGATHRPGGGTTSGGPLCDPAVVMDYYDGNTVTGLWNYAQRYAMSDNSFSPTFGPSSPGAVNLISGDTGGVDTAHEVNNPSVASSSAPNADLTPDGAGGFSLTSDAQPYWDDCSTRDAVALSGRNIGDELNDAGLSWGWFQGGFRPSTSFSDAAAATGHVGQTTATFVPDEFKGKFAAAPASDQGICNAVTPVGVALGETAATHQFGFKDDYIPHHEPFDYHASTANPHHLPPASLRSIGSDTQHYVGGVPQFDTANHQYDITDFDQLVAAITAGTMPASALPAVSFLKAPAYEDGHAAYSDPADEQAFVVSEVNALMKTPDWPSTAIVVDYDDSDGWYDHAFSGVTNPSASVADNLTGTVKKPASGTSGACGSESAGSAPLAGRQGRCGFGPRQPFLVISPCAKSNAVDHDLSDLASVPNFVEYNWSLAHIPGSFDQALAGADAREGVAFDLAGLFDFSKCDNPAVQLSPTTGQVDLAGANLRGQNLKGANLSGADLSNATVQGVNLKNGFLENANLKGAHLEGTNLDGADLAGADLAGAALTGTNLNGADLTGADLTGASLSGSNTNKVTWSSTTCVDGTNSSANGGTCNGHL